MDFVFLGALIFAIVMVIAVLNLRTVLSVRFGESSFTPIALIAPPKSFADLYPDEAKALSEVGFQGPFWSPAKVLKPPFICQPVALFVHPHGVLAQLAAPQDVAAPNLCHLTLISICGEQRVASGRFQLNEVMSTSKSSHRNSKSLVISDLWRFHQQQLVDLAPPMPISRNTQAAAQFANLSLTLDERALLAEGKIRRCSDGTIRASIAFAMRSLLANFQKPATPDIVQPIPSERLVHFHRRAEAISHLTPTRPVQWGLFAASTVLSMAIGLLIFDWLFAVLLLAIILFHELGHFLAMAAFGYRNLQVLALPLVGAVWLLASKRNRIPRIGHGWRSPDQFPVLSWELRWHFGAYSTRFQSG